VLTTPLAAVVQTPAKVRLSLSRTHGPRSAHAATCAWIVLAVAASAPVSAVAAPAPGAPAIAVEPAVSTSGYFRVSWALNDAGGGQPGRNGETPDDVRFELEETRGVHSSDATLLYDGRDLATVITGRGNGTYRYRVRALVASAGASPWSERVAVQVRHHSRSRALGFFAAGAVVFVATVGLVVVGSATSKREGTT
jgi:hypothetical protein